MGRIVHFEITADDLTRASRFYTESFGWKQEDSPFVDGYRLAATGDGPGIDGAVMKREFRTQPAIPWLQVDDLDATLKRVRAAGGAIAGERNTIPGRGDVIYVTDTEGNTLGVIQPV